MEIGGEAKEIQDLKLCDGFKKRPTFLRNHAAILEADKDSVDWSWEMQPSRITKNAFNKPGKENILKSVVVAESRDQSEAIMEPYISSLPKLRNIVAIKDVNRQTRDVFDVQNRFAIFNKECDIFEKLEISGRAKDSASVTHVPNSFSSSPKPSWINFVRNSISESAKSPFMNSWAINLMEGRHRWFALRKTYRVMKL